MAVDTEAKRRSALNYASAGYSRAGPIPDGSIDKSDQLTLLNLYEFGEGDPVPPLEPTVVGAGPGAFRCRVLHRFRMTNFRR